MIMPKMSKKRKMALIKAIRVNKRMKPAAKKKALTTLRKR